MGKNSAIGWTHHTWNPYLGCDKIAPECCHCYIDRVLLRMGRRPWGILYKTKTWDDPARWEKKAAKENLYYRVFTCSLSDFFHVRADEWRPRAWEIIKATPHMIYLILTKRPELAIKRLPLDWGDGYPNVWLGVSSGCEQTLNKMDSLRKIPAKLRFLSAEPLLEDISSKINLDGFGWVITGGESGHGVEYMWNRSVDWRKEFNTGGRRTMQLEWPAALYTMCKRRNIPYFFKQITAIKPGQGEDALGAVIQQFPEAPGTWATNYLKQQSIA